MPRLKQNPSQDGASAPTGHPHPMHLYRTSTSHLNTLHSAFYVKKTCLSVSFYFIRFRALPVTHGSNLQSPS